MRVVLVRWLLCLFSLLCGHGAFAGERDSVAKKCLHILGIDFKPAYVFPTSGFFKGENARQFPIRKNLSAHLKYGMKFSPDTYWGKYYPHAHQGIGFGYNTFGNSEELGNPLAVYVFQTSRIVALTRKLSLDYEWNFGASFGWKKYDREHNAYNEVVGSKTNAYIQIGMLLNWEITPAAALRVGIALTHYSNGNTGYPNAGVNTVGANIGLSYSLGKAAAQRKYVYSPGKGICDVVFRPHMSYDLIVYGATKKKGVILNGDTPLLVPGSFAIAGVNFNPLYNFSRYFRAGLSLDMQYDESANIANHIATTLPNPAEGDVKFYRPSPREQYSLGLSVRAEVVMPVFSINLGIGKNFVCKGADTDSFYQIFALKTDVTKNLFLHVGYQLYRFQDPNNLMLGLGVRFNARRGR